MKPLLFLVRLGVGCKRLFRPILSVERVAEKSIRDRLCVRMRPPIVEQGTKPMFSGRELFPREFNQRERHVRCGIAFVEFQCADGEFLRGLFVPFASRDRGKARKRVCVPGWS